LALKYARALLPGRFQPFHKGHLHAVKYALSLSRELIIVVTAAQFCYTPDNPFTAGERVEMIRLALGDLYDRCYIIPVDNVPNNALWMRHLSLRVPRFEAVFTNNELVRLLAEKEGYRVEPIPFLRREVYEGKKARKAIVEGGDWRSLVPTPVAEFLSSIKAEERLRRLSKTEPIPLPER